MTQQAVAVRGHRIVNGNNSGIPGRLRAFTAELAERGLNAALVLGNDGSPSQD
jgi:hypothetical protein